MKNLSTYIQHLDFEYAISYSGLRGPKFKRLEEENEKKIKIAEKEIESARFMQKPKLNRKIEELENEISIYNSRVINKDKERHRSTIEVHKFEKGDKELREIFAILTSKFEEQHLWMCPPIFRDAIVFYSKEHDVKGILQMCFSCSWIKNEEEEDFEVDHKIFPRLKNQLIRLGHKIENE